MKKSRPGFGRRREARFCVFPAIAMNFTGKTAFFFIMCRIIPWRPFCLPDERGIMGRISAGEREGAGDFFSSGRRSCKKNPFPRISGSFAGLDRRPSFIWQNIWEERDFPQLFFTGNEKGLEKRGKID